MNFQPLHDKVLIKRDESEEVSPGGIFIPQNAAEKPIRGEVIAAGGGHVLKDGTVRPLDVKAGDRVLFAERAGREVKLDGQEYLILPEAGVLGVFAG
jgi:chaperonin GroES